MAKRNSKKKAPAEVENDGGAPEVVKTPKVKTPKAPKAQAPGAPSLETLNDFIFKRSKK